MDALQVLLVFHNVRHIPDGFKGETGRRLQALLQRGQPIQLALLLLDFLRQLLFPLAQQRSITLPGSSSFSSCPITLMDRPSSRRKQMTCRRRTSSSE